MAPEGVHVNAPIAAYNIAASPIWIPELVVYTILYPQCLGHTLQCVACTLSSTYYRYKVWAMPSNILQISFTLVDLQVGSWK